METMVSLFMGKEVEKRVATAVEEGATLGLDPEGMMTVNFLPKMLDLAVATPASKQREGRRKEEGGKKEEQREKTFLPQHLHPNDVAVLIIILPSVEVSKINDNGKSQTMFLTGLLRRERQYK